ncbi:MAG: sigma-70 family RNA polymerase sigma factor [Pseudomonadota bacterium]
MSTDTVMQDFEQLLGAVRPRLHRYCARMTGSTTDGEDVVQEALIKAFAARPSSGTIDNAEAWLLRIAHNCALDLLRSRTRQLVTEAEEDFELVPAPDAPDPDIVTTSLQRFMPLPALQRSAVILKDVLGHSLEEAAAITDTSETALKSALQRGRARLRAAAQQLEAATAPEISGTARARLIAYVDGFNQGDFDAVRAMLAEDVRLDLVAKFKRRGREEVGEYLGRYAASRQWAFAAGLIDDRPAMLVYERAASAGKSAGKPVYFVALDIEEDQIVSVRDFLFARYAMEGLEPRTV